MKLRTFFYGLIAAVVALLVIAAVGFYKLTANNPLAVLQRSGQPSPTAAMFIPKQAPVMASLLVNPEQLAEARVVSAPPGQRRQAKAELEQLKQNLLSSTQLDYEQDIKPWLGNEITLAVTTPDIDRDRQNGRQPGYLMAIATQNPDRASEFLQLFWQRRAVAGTDLVFEQFAGAKIIYGSAPTSNDPVSTLATAVVGNQFVLFANSPKVLRDAINNVQAPDLSLSRSDAYQEALRSLPDRQISLAFINLPKLSAWLADDTDVVEIAESASTDPLFESLVMTVDLDPHGLTADTALLTAAGKQLQPAKPHLSKPVEALNYIPASSPLSASGENLQDLWTQLEAGLTDYRTLSALVNQPLTAIASQWGINSVTDLVTWVKGEYASGLLPNANKPQPDWVFVAERVPEAEQAIEQFDTIAKQQGLSTGAFPLNNQQVYAWTKLLPTTPKGKELISLKADVQAVHATIDKYEIFASSAEAMSQALQSSKLSLLVATNLKQAINALAHDNDGYLYVDWLATRDLVEKRFPIVRLVELAGKPFFDHLRSLTITSYGSERTIRRGGVFIQLKD